MLWAKQATHRATVTWAIVVAMGCTLVPTPAQAAWWWPFNRSAGWGPPSGKTTSAAHRGGACASARSQPPLSAIAPTSAQLIDEFVLSVTTQAYPTLWFYLPYTIGAPSSSAGTAKAGKPVPPAIELRLEEKDADDDAYSQRTIMTLSHAKAGIVGFPLTPESLQTPLEVDKLYRWLLVVHCIPGDASANTFTRLNLVRVAPQPLDPQSLEFSAPQRKLYTQYGLWEAVQAGAWNDFITTLAALSCRSPNDATLTAVWAQSLTDVGLKPIAQKPLLCASTPPVRNEN